MDQIWDSQDEEKAVLPRREGKVLQRADMGGEGPEKALAPGIGSPLLLFWSR